LTLAAPLGVILAVLAGGATWKLSVRQYRSQATLKIVDKQPFVAFPTQEYSADFSQTQIELLKGPFIIGRAIENEGLAQVPDLREISGDHLSLLKEPQVRLLAEELNAALDHSSSTTPDVSLVAAVSY